MEDGFLVASDAESAHYLFIIGKTLYSGAVMTKTDKHLTPVADFFSWYAKKGSANLEVVKGDKKLLLCMLVKLSHKATQTFTTDVIDLEDVIKKIDDGKKDCIVALHGEKGWGFSIFIGGNALATFVDKAPELDQTPLDRLLLYTHSMPHDKPLSVEVFGDTRVVPASDSGDMPAAPVTAHFAKPSSGATIEVLEDGKPIGTFPVSGAMEIGREKTNAIMLAEAGVSRSHAVIEEKNGKFIITDHKSANGTFFKGTRIESKELHNGDEITIRKYTLRFHAAKGAEKSEPEEDLASKTIFAEMPPMPAKAPAAQPGQAAQAAAGIGQADAGATASVVFADGNSHPLGSITTIGKDAEADIKVEGMLVGKRHATIIRGKGMYKIIKKEGLAPLKINGEKKDEHVLKDGDSIEISGLKLTFRAGKV